MRNFSYNAQKQLASETNPSIVNGVQGYTYDAYGRRTGMTFGNGVDTMAQANYTYDTTGRIATVGNGANTLTYTYVPGTGMIQSAAWNSATLNTAYTYDQYKRLTDIHVNNTPVYGYELNAKNQRTGATLPDGKTWTYNYDTLGQLTQAQKQDGATLLQNMLYNYDLIGNRTSATENSTTTNYTSNLVNQYTQIAAQIPTYDADGNMTYYNGWNFTWNGENRMIAAENFTTGIRVEADYDYMGRRSYKKVYSNNTLTKHIKFVYDGYKLIAEFDASSDDTQIASYLWQPVGLDVPLMRNEEYYIADGNKNIIQLRDNSGAITKTYAYNPFGALESPTIGDDNPFRFSSEYADDETALIYYNYRYYSPLDGRWINRDPISEQGGVNLYAMCGNNVINNWDGLGFSCCGKDITEKFNKLLAAVVAELSQEKYAFMVYDLGPFSVLDGWDIKGFDSSVTPGTAATLAKRPKECQDTVTYNGKCYRVAFINYALWGIIGEIGSRHQLKLQRDARSRYPYSDEGIPDFAGRFLVASVYPVTVGPARNTNRDAEGGYEKATKGRLGFINMGIEFAHNGTLNIPEGVDCTDICGYSTEIHDRDLIANIRFNSQNPKFLNVYVSQNMNNGVATGNSPISSLPGELQ